MTRHASKGVVDLILPDELRPITELTGQPIDFIYNPFGVFSRMNLSQLLECTCAKATWKANQNILKDNNSIEKELLELNSNIISNLNNDNYFNNINLLIKKIKQDSKFKDEFIHEISKNNLFIEVPSFTRINLKEILRKTSVHPNENVILKKELIKYMQQKMGCLKDYIINQDIVLPNVFCGPMYIQKLYKLANKLIMSRDFGPLKTITQQPRRGRALQGGSAIGQMEIEAIISNGCDKALKELLTIKNDWNSEKKNFLWEIISTGRYNLPKNIPKNSSRTKIVVNTLLNFLKK